VVIEKTLESPLDCKEIKPVSPKLNESWIFIGRTEAPILSPPDIKSQLTGKDPDAGKYWGQEEKGYDRGWDGWKASRTQCTWIRANSGRRWRMGKPGVLQSVGLQRVRHNWGTEQQQQMFIFLDIMPLTPNTACAQCVQLCDLMDCSPPGSSVHGISQARIPEWVAIPSSRGSSPPRDQTRISCIAGRFFTAEPPGLPHT